MVVLLVVAAAVAALARGTSRGPTPLQKNARLRTSNGWVFARQPNEAIHDGAASSDPDANGGPEAEAYVDRAYPANGVGVAQVRAALDAFKTSRGRGDAHNGGWQSVGPTSPLVPGLVSNAGYTDAFQSGRATAIAVAPNCTQSSCTLYLGTAGGGVWVTNNALADKPSWQPASNGLFSSAIGSIAIDPGDPSGRTLYVGTGEENGSSDSEAGAGVYRSTDGGRSWSILIGSINPAVGRSVGSIAVDPANPQHIFIGTDVARHGASSVIGGRFTPPDAAPVGLYESVDGGQSFSLAFSKPSDSVNPASPNGSDFFRGGVSKIAFDPIVAGRIWFSMFDYGLFRSATGGGYEQVFASPSGGAAADSSIARTEFALAPMGSKLRVYVGDTSSAYPAFFDPPNVGSGSRIYRNDDAEVAAATLVGTGNSGWTRLTAGDNYCEIQCSYDMPLDSPAGRPDELWAGGTMFYSRIAGNSNGQAVIRTTDAGATFTDMTLDKNKVALHPDQHFLAAGPAGVEFVANDGGLARTNGTFSDTSADCTSGWHPFATSVATCQAWLKSTPDQIISMNDGLGTLQFQSVSVNPHDSTDVMGGTQDNGTWTNRGDGNTWFETIGGDGGQSGIGLDGVRMHTYFGKQVDVNFHGVQTLGWDWTGDQLGAGGEAASFYIPLIADPANAGTWFLGEQHVWRTTDNGGDQAFLDQYCAEYTGDYAHRPHACGDWGPIGPSLVSTSFGTDKLASPSSQNYVVALTRASAASDPQGNILWAATRQGRVFISTNAGKTTQPANVTFTRIDNSTTPTRFVSGISVDPANPYHAFVSYSGYDAYAQAAGTATGHVFEVTVDPRTMTATWNNLSYDLGDQPITGIAYDGTGGNLYVSTDWGVLQLFQRGHNTSWKQAAPGLPLGAVYGLTIAPTGRVMYAATHGHSVWALDLSSDKGGPGAPGGPGNPGAH